MPSSSSSAPEHGWCRACGCELWRLPWSDNLPDHARIGSGVPCVNDGTLVPVSPGEAANSTDQAVRDLWGYEPVPDWMRIAQDNNRQITASMAIPPPQLSHPRWSGGAGGSMTAFNWTAGGGEYASEPGFPGQQRDLARAIVSMTERSTWKPAGPSHGPLSAVPEAPQVPDEPYVIHRANFIDTGDREELRLMEQAYAEAWPRDPRPREEVEHESLETSVPRSVAAPEPRQPWLARHWELIVLALVFLAGMLTALGWPS